MSHQPQTPIEHNLEAIESVGVPEHAQETGAHEQAAATEEVSHEHTLFAETVFQVNGFPITNSLIASWIVVLLILVISLITRAKLKKIPGKFQSVIEIIVETGLNMCDTVTHDRKQTLRIFPIIITLFIFILLNNYLGLIPGVGSIGFNQVHDGHHVFVPLLRGGTADLNTTLALALIAVLGANFFGIVIVGIWNYINKFVNLKAFIEIPGKVIKEPTIVLVNPIKAFVGVVEIIGEIAKVASLSFRLFGNIFAGEVLLASMAALFAYLTPVPFIFLELIVGIVQALVFAMLTLVYFAIASSAEEH